MKRHTAHYDTYDYPSYWKTRDYEHQSEVLALSSLLETIPSLGKVADIGGGFGRLIPHYKEKAEEVLLIEPSRNLLDLARRNLNNDQKVKFLHSPIEDVLKKVKPGSLDSILMIRVMHHLADPYQAAQTFSKLLKNNGYVIVEFANKIHGKALFTNICRGDFAFSSDVTPSDRRCTENRKNNVISFYNYHPATILDALAKNGLKPRALRSVSNVRSSRLKKYISLKGLLRVEQYMQKPLASLYFGPSIFVLAQKQAP